MTSLVVRKLIGGGLLKPERVRVICPACGEQVESVARDGQVKGYCAVAEQYVDFSITPEIAAPIGSAAGTAGIRAKISAAMKKRWQDPEYRAKQIDTDSHFTAERKAKISAALKRYYTKRRGLITPEIAAPMGSQGTVDTRAKISVGRTSKHPTAETRPKYRRLKRVAISRLRLRTKYRRRLQGGTIKGDSTPESQRGSPSYPYFSEPRPHRIENKAYPLSFYMKSPAKSSNESYELL